MTGMRMMDVRAREWRDDGYFIMDMGLQRFPENSQNETLYDGTFYSQLNLAFLSATPLPIPESILPANTF